jgi:hypothetical protein
VPSFKLLILILQNLKSLSVYVLQVFTTCMHKFGVRIHHFQVYHMCSLKLIEKYDPQRKISSSIAYHRYQSLNSSVHSYKFEGPHIVLHF